MKKLLSLVLALVLCAALLPVSAETAVQPITVTDMTGRTVELAAPAQRIVAITAANVEVLYALGAGETVVGRGEYCNYPEEALSVVSVKSGYELNVEEIVALEPDLVIMDTMAQTPEQVEALENSGIPVLMTAENGVAGVYEAITLIGAVVGKNTEAADLNAKMQAAFAELEALDFGLTVYYEVSPLEWGLWTCGTATFMDEIGAMLGLTNVFGDLTGWASVSEEQVIDRNPAVIITTSGWYGYGPMPDEEILGRTGWENVSAVAAGNVFVADSDSFTRPGPRLADAAHQLAAWLSEITAK